MLSVVLLFSPSPKSHSKLTASLGITNVLKVTDEPAIPLDVLMVSCQKMTFHINKQ